MVSVSVNPASQEGCTGSFSSHEYSSPPARTLFQNTSLDACMPQLNSRSIAERFGTNAAELNCGYLRCYQASCADCSHCGRRKTCFETNSARRRVLASNCYPAFFRGHSRVGTPAYLAIMRLRRIWAEGSFSVLKREHCLSKIRKRGIPAVTEECLLSVMALNLKRMVKASFFQLSLPFMCHVGRNLLWNDYFVNRSFIVPYQVEQIVT